MKKALIILSKLLSYGLLGLGIILLLLGIRESLMLFAFASFFGSWFFAWLLIKKGFPPESKFELCVNLGLWFNILGEAWIYYGITYYDKILHFFMGILITIIIYQYYKTQLKVKKDMIFLTVLGLLTTWEIYEYVLFTFFNYPVMGVIINGQMLTSPLDDTFRDLIWGSIGSIIYLIFRKEDPIGKIKKIRKSRK